MAKKDEKLFKALTGGDLGGKSKPFAPSAKTLASAEAAKKATHERKMAKRAAKKGGSQKKMFAAEKKAAHGPGIKELSKGLAADRKAARLSSEIKDDKKTGKDPTRVRSEPPKAAAGATEGKKAPKGKVPKGDLTVKSRTPGKAHETGIFGTKRMSGSHLSSRDEAFKKQLARGARDAESQSVQTRTKMRRELGVGDLAGARNQLRKKARAAGDDTRVKGAGMQAKTGGAKVKEMRAYKRTISGEKGKVSTETVGQKMDKRLAKDVAKPALSSSHSLPGGHQVTVTATRGKKPVVPNLTSGGAEKKPTVTGVVGGAKKQKTHIALKEGGIKAGSPEQKKRTAAAIKSVNRNVDKIMAKSKPGVSKSASDVAKAATSKAEAIAAKRGGGLKVNLKPLGDRKKPKDLSYTKPEPQAKLHSRKMIHAAAKAVGKASGGMSHGTKAQASAEFSGQRVAMHKNLKKAGKPRSLGGVQVGKKGGRFVVVNGHKNYVGGGAGKKSKKR